MRCKASSEQAATAANENGFTKKSLFLLPIKAHHYKTECKSPIAVYWTAALLDYNS